MTNAVMGSLLAGKSARELVETLMGGEEKFDDATLRVKGGFRNIVKRFRGGKHTAKVMCIALVKDCGFQAAQGKTANQYNLWRRDAAGNPTEIISIKFQRTDALIDIVTREQA